MRWGLNSLAGEEVKLRLKAAARITGRLHQIGSASSGYLARLTGLRSLGSAATTPQTSVERFINFIGKAKKKKKQFVCWIIAPMWETLMPRGKSADTATSSVNARRAASRRKLRRAKRLCSCVAEEC